MKIRSMAVACVAMAAPACVKYTPAPLDPSRAPLAYAARTLSDSAVRTWVSDHATALDASATVSDAQLVVLALGLRPELDVARGDLATSRAATVTAGQRPQPGLAADLERRYSGIDQGGPWVISIAPQLTLELGGKRAARIRVAVAQVAEQEFRLRERAYEVVSEVRATVVELANAQRTTASLRTAASALADVGASIQARVDQGGASASDVARSRADLQGIAVEIAALQRQEREQQASLAAAVGVPVTALRDFTVVDRSTGGCSWLRSTGRLASDSIALQLRYPVGQALAGYVVADAALKLEIARQYPDVQFGPGFAWDQGTNRFALGFGVPSLNLNRNRGPIGEADALRDRAAAVVAQAQEQVLAGMSAVRAACDRQRAEAAVADSLVSATANVRAQVQAAFDRGERGRLDVALAVAAESRARVAQAEAVGRQRRADIAAEIGAGVWLAAAPIRWPDPIEPSPLRPRVNR